MTHAMAADAPVIRPLPHETEDGSDDEEGGGGARLGEPRILTAAAALALAALVRRAAGAPLDELAAACGAVGAGAAALSLAGLALRGRRAARPAAAPRVYFVRDDHTSTAEQRRLEADVSRGAFARGVLWVEFVYEQQLSALREAWGGARAEEGGAAEAAEAALRELEAGLAHDGWGAEYNRAVVRLLRAAHAHGMGVRALDDEAWSLGAFEARHGKFRGGLKYLRNRASPQDDGEAASSRWARKVLAGLAADGAARGPVVVVGGAEHGTPMARILAAHGVRVDFLYEPAEAVHSSAAEKLHAALERTQSERSLHDTDDDDDHGAVRALIAALRQRCREASAHTRAHREHTAHPRAPDGGAPAAAAAPGGA